MKGIVFRLINLIALLAAVAWLARSPDWEPLVTSLAFLATLIGQEVLPVLKGSPKKEDKRLLEKFLSEFPSNGQTARFLENHDIGAPFPSNDLSELDNFIRNWESAEHEFQDKRIETQRKKFLRLAIEFRHKLSINIFSNNGGFLTMDLKDYEDRPEILQRRDELNEMATSLYKEHQELVRIGRRYV